MSQGLVIAWVAALLAAVSGASVARPESSEPQGVDLAVEKVEVTPQPVIVGQQETILVTVRNVGQTTVATSPCPAQVFVNDVRLNVACTQLAVELPPGAAIIQQTPWLPDSAGQKTITAQIRYGGDTNPANDTMKVSVAVAAPTPVTDIAVVGISLLPEADCLPPPIMTPETDGSKGSRRRQKPEVEGNAVVGQSTRVEVRIANQGNQRVRLQNPQDVSVTIDGTPLEYAYPFYPIDLPPGWTGAVAFRWTPKTAGEAQLVASVKALNDGTYIPPEEDIADNTLSASVPVVDPVRDVAVKSIEVSTGPVPLPLGAEQSSRNHPGTGVPSPPGGGQPYPKPLPPAAGEPANIIVSVENQGNVWEREIRIQVTVNGKPLDDNVVDAKLAPCILPPGGSEDASNCIIPPFYCGLPPGGVGTYYFTWVPPAVGTYEIVATVAPVEGETDLDDNSGRTVVEITEQRIHDMSLDNVELAESAIAPGSTVKILLTISNKGTVREDNVYVNATVNGRRYLYRSVGSFNPGETKQIQMLGRIPRRAKPGTYILQVTIPPVFAETNLENNSKQITFLVGPGSGTTGGSLRPSR